MDHRMTFADHRTNIGEGQRVLSAITGMIFLASGLPRHTWTGVARTIVGAGLLYRALTGYCPAVGALRIDRTRNDQPGRPNDRNGLGRRQVHTGHAVKMHRAIEINRPPHDIYQFWRSLDNLPRILKHLDSVQVINDQMSHWAVTTIPGTPMVEWDAEIIHDVKNKRIRWQSLPGADVHNAGSVDFKPTDAGKRTWLTVTLQYDPPGSQLGVALTKLFGEDPNTKLAQDLQRFKEQIETNVFSLAGGEGKV